MLFSQPGHNLCIKSQSSALCLSSFVYPTMPPAATFLTAPSITMDALYITSDWLTAVELLWNLNTYLPFSPQLPCYGVVTVATAQTSITITY